MGRAYSFLKQSIKIESTNCSEVAMRMGWAFPFAFGFLFALASLAHAAFAAFLCELCG